MTRIRIILNPAARGGQSTRALQRVMPILERAGLRADVAMSRDLADLRRLALEASDDRDVGLVAMCGGDGTSTAAAQVMVHADTPMAVIPAGTGNDFARGLGIPIDARAAARVIVDGFDRTVDLAQATDLTSGETRRFACVAGLGLDLIALQALRDVPWLTGPLKYTYGGLRGLLGYRPRWCRVIVGDRVFDGDAMLVAITNTPTYGGGMRINPAARLDDGELDVCVVRATSRANLVVKYPLVYLGKHVGLPEIWQAHGSRVKVEAEQPMTLCLDGEITSLASPLLVEAIPMALKVRVPAGR
ncbi:MAG: diacylglycerol kinase family lipid kinase [Chloroflexota bacterium]|nr:MAG: diacylglycerol kinase family lipid kinase [Chloroflexota bacterium]